MTEDEPYRYGTDIDPERLADQLEMYAKRLRNNEGYLQGVEKEYKSNIDEFDVVSVTIECVGQKGIPLFDSDVHPD